MQPYFFPYLGYFSLLKNTEKFILLDSVQFIRHGWIERNRILKLDGNCMYIKVPLIKHSRGTLIKNIRIKNDQNWKNKILSQIQHYKKKAPFFIDVKNLLNTIFEKKMEDITTLNCFCLESVCNYLGFRPDISIFSNLDLTIDIPTSPDEWALNICKSIGNVTEYWNPPGGIDFFNRDKYEKEGIKLNFQKIQLLEYKQLGNPFLPGLSIIDVMMFNSPETINTMLGDYKIIYKPSQNKLDIKS